MPTAAERQALMFLALLAVIGGGARVVAARRFQDEIAIGGGKRVVRADLSGEEAALNRQLEAIDSAQSARKARAGTKGKPRATSGANARNVTAQSSARAVRPTLKNGDRRAPLPPIDVNRASLRELEQLPRVGPALARRIVAWRDEHGPFESLESLRHVRGIGVTTAAGLAPLVTFSSGSRPYRSDNAAVRRDHTPQMR